MLREGSCQLGLCIARIERSALGQEQKLFALVGGNHNLVNDACHDDIGREWRRRSLMHRPPFYRLLLHPQGTARRGPRWQHHR